MAFTISNNTPSVGCIQWAGLNMQYKGVSYAITNGYTNYIYAYWTPAAATSLVVSNTFPTLGTDDCLVFLNKSGVAVTVPSSTVISGDLIVPGSVVANALAANTITGDKIAAGTISAGNIAVGTISANLIAANAIGATAISAACITGDKIVADAITAREIAASTITATQIAALTITAAKIVAGTITATQIAAGTITAGQIAAGTITATQITAGTITAGQIAAGTITATQIAAGTISANLIAANAIGASAISAGAITADKIAAGSITAEKLTIGSGDQGGYLNNPRFSKWSGTYPDGSSLWSAGGVSKVVVDTVNMTQFNCPVLANQYGMTLDSTAFAKGIDLDAMQYLCIELRFRITSGTNANGACMLVDIYRQDATYERIQLNCSDAGSTLTLNTWYTVRKIFKLSDATVAKTFKSVSGYLLANFSSGGGGNAIKTIQFASINMYQATLQDYLAQTWTYPGQVTIGGGNIQANTITASQIAAGTITASQIATNTITATQIAAGAITASELSAGCITADKISGNTLNAITITGSTITGSTISAINSLSVTGSGTSFGTLRLNNAWNKLGTIYSNDQRGINFESVGGYLFWSGDVQIASNLIVSGKTTTTGIWSSGLESRFSIGAYTDPFSGRAAAIKSSNSICASEFYAINGCYNDRTWRCIGSSATGLINSMNDGTTYLEVQTSNHGAFGLTWWASDISLKTNVCDAAQDSLSKIMQMQHRQFDWKTGGHVGMGYVAQELQAIDKEFVFGVTQEDNTEILNPSQNVIIPHITKAIQQLKDEVDSLRLQLLAIGG